MDNHTENYMSINIDNSYCHRLNIAYNTDHYIVECRTSMTSVNIEIKNTDNYDDDKLNECFEYCEYLKTQKYSDLFHKLGYCPSEFVKWLLYIKQQLIDNKFDYLCENETNIIKTVFVVGISMVKSTLSE